MSARNETTSFDAPPQRGQLPWRKLVRMSKGSLRHHMTASALQMLTIAATAAFLMFVLGEIITTRAARELPTAAAEAGGNMAHLIWMLAISLLVCAISNVMSMLLSVTRRFREIGTMKCLGAFDRTVLLLFMVEATVVGCAGAVAGVVLGVILSALTALSVRGTAVFSPRVAAQLVGAGALTLVVVVLLSFVGSAYPAWRASRMLPVEAMRRT